MNAIVRTADRWQRHTYFRDALLEGSTLTTRLLLGALSLDVMDRPNERSGTPSLSFRRFQMNLEASALEKLGLDTLVSRQNGAGWVCRGMG